MMEINEQERALVGAFIIKDKRERYLQMLANPKRRRDILDRFNHLLDFDPSFAALVPKEMRTSERVVQLLRQRGAPEMCHVVVDSLDIDSEDLPLKEALESIIAHDFGSVVCCLPGRLAFHKPEAVEQTWYILEKK